MEKKKPLKLATRREDKLSTCPWLLASPGGRGKPGRCFFQRNPLLGKPFRRMEQGEKEKEKEVPSRQLRAECSLGKLHGGPKTSSEQGADPRQGKVTSVDLSFSTEDGVV